MLVVLGQRRQLMLEIWLLMINDDKARQLNAIAWYYGNMNDEFDLQGFDYGTRKVGKKKANAWGFYDMLGNVYEWCEDGMRDYAEAGGKLTPRG